MYVFSLTVSVPHTVIFSFVVFPALLVKEECRILTSQIGTFDVRGRDPRSLRPSDTLARCLSTYT